MINLEDIKESNRIEVTFDNLKKIAIRTNEGLWKFNIALNNNRYTDKELFNKLKEYKLRHNTKNIQIFMLF